MIEVPLTYDGARRSTPLLEWHRSPARPALQVVSALDSVRRAPTILSAMRSAPQATAAVEATVSQGVASEVILEPIIEALDDADDTITALAAVHALARVPGLRAETRLVELVLEAASGFEQHALWALGARAASHGLVGPVARAVTHGGLAGMHAQGALARWSLRAPHLVLFALESTLREVEAADARRYLVETIGLVPGRYADRTLERVALDPDEAWTVRTTAIAAFSERMDAPLPPSLQRLATEDGEIGKAVRSTRAHRQLLRRGPRRGSDRAAGIRAAQIHLGESGGVATLLPQLGEMLAGQSRIAEVVTIVRSPGPVLADDPATTSHRLERIALEPGEGSAFSSRWPSVVAAERGVRGSFLAGPAPDVVHLRMADPGTYAGAAVARSMSIPLVFTLAPDPHGPIAAAEAAGSLDRQSFASEDGRSALWLRASLVERLAHEARELVLFPRADVQARVHSLTGVDLAAGPPRHTVIAEGVDTWRLDAATAAIEREQEEPAVLADLQRAIRSLPRARHGLPIVVTAGRMQAVKGMARLVETFALDAELGAQANLVIVGGHLESPSASEAAELTRIQQLFDRHPGLSERVILLGQRSHRDVALVLAAARAGWRSFFAPGGSYACASAKEEFGLAIVEALAAGVPVTAPVQGGPATYVTSETGVLVDTTDTQALARGIRATLELAARPETAARARAVVDARYTLARMARALTAVYRVTTGAATLAAPVPGEPEAAA